MAFVCTCTMHRAGIAGWNVIGADKCTWMGLNAMDVQESRLCPPQFLAPSITHQTAEILPRHVDIMSQLQKS